MEQVLARLKEAAEIRNTIAKQEAAFWQKIADALDGYTSRQKWPAEHECVPASKPAKAITYMTNPQAAEYLGLAKGTLDKWRVFGDGPKFIKIGRSVRYKVTDLDDFAVKNRFSRTSSMDTESDRQKHIKKAKGAF